MEGEQRVEVARGGIPQLCGAGRIPINNTIEKYNFNAVVGRATIGGCPKVVPVEEKQVLIRKPDLV